MNPVLCIFARTLTRLSLMQFALFTQRRQVKRVCFYCYLLLSLDCHIFTFINTETGISLLLLCLAVCLPKADAADHYNARKLKTAELAEMLKIVKSLQKPVEDKYKNESLSYHPKGVTELHLYTPENVPSYCFETAFNCFIKEMRVLQYEFSMDSFELKNVNILNKNAKTFSKFSLQKKCTICEECQETNATYFLKAFEALLQKKNKGL
ncbi:interleukin 15, like isoform X2 [Heterodontus francisci]|uniref:interleukin 15, like isoform X2 n=1 Tax=Heterodontus francisci TaxID=7792 RepID=UPI00355B55F7